MAFSLTWDSTNSLVIATVTGGSETSPNLASDLADAIIASGDANINNKAFHNGHLVWFDSLSLDLQPSSWFKWDDDAQVELRTKFQSIASNETSANENDGASTIFGLRSVIHQKVSSNDYDARCRPCGTGGQFIALRDSIGVNPCIYKENNARNDYPTFSQSASTLPARVRLEGLSYRIISGGTSSQKWYFGNSRNIQGDDIIQGLSLSGGGEIFQIYNTNYVAPFIPQFSIGGESASSLIRIIDGTFNTDNVASTGFNGSFRKGRYYLDSPLFPNNVWDGTIINGFDSGGTPKCFCIRYKQSIEITDGINYIQNAKIRITTKIRNAGSGYDLSALNDFPQDTNINITTSTKIEQMLIDTLRARSDAGTGDVDGDTESYKYDIQIRDYDYLGLDYLVQNRIYGVGGLLGNASDIFIMTEDDNTTLSETDAQNLTQIITAEEFYSVAKEYWVNSDNFNTSSMYVTRVENKINAKGYNVNFDPSVSDAFAFDGTTITIKSNYFTDNITTTGVVSLLNGAFIEGNIVDANADSYLEFKNIDSWNVYGSQADMDSDSNILASGSGYGRYRFMYSAGDIYYIKAIIDGNTFTESFTPTSSGQNTISSITLSLKGLQTGSDVVILEAGTDNVLTSYDQITGNDFSYSYLSPKLVDIGIIKPTYIPKYIYGYQMSNQNAELPIKQVQDRSYE